MEARQASMDIFDIYITRGETPDKVMDARLMHWLTELITLLEDLIQETQLRRAQKRNTVVARPAKDVAKTQPTLPSNMGLAIEAPIIIFGSSLSIHACHDAMQYDIISSYGMI